MQADFAPCRVRNSKIGLLLSGGLDSAILLGHLLGKGYQVRPFYVISGCVWQDCELRAVRKFCAALAGPSLAELTLLDMPVDDLYADHWSISGLGAPDDRTPDEAVFLFGRNPLLLLKPALWCQMHGVPQLAIATVATNPFGDATPEFFASFEAMLHEATGAKVSVLRPFERLAKHSVMQLGRELPLELTFSCLAPVAELHCGICNKCAERIAAFHHLDSGDPTRYAFRADETPVAAVACHDADRNWRHSER
jgi:7-cyano-7-deazaguanine synthase